MENRSKSESRKYVAPKDLKPEEIPTMEKVLEWCQRDLVACHYFLGLMLRYPEVVKKAAEEMYEHVKMKEGGSAIDTAKAAAVEVHLDKKAKKDGY